MNKEKLLIEKEKLEKTLLDINSKLEKLKLIEEDEIKRKDSVKDKTRISQLTPKDCVFCIEYNKNTKNVDWAGYLNVEYCQYIGKDKYYMFGVSHKTEPQGFSSSFAGKYGYKDCVLFDFYSSFKFITIKPERWEKGLEECMMEFLLDKKESYNNEVRNIESHFKEMFETYKKYGKEI